MKVMLVASSGGHLAHLLWLRPWWDAHERTWVTFNTPDAVAALADEQIAWAVWPTNRNPWNFVRNLVRAVGVVRRERPDVLVTSGAGVAVPFVLVAKAQGVPCVYLEVYDRVTTVTLTARLLARVVDEVVCQWPAQRDAIGRGVVLGPILGGST